MTKCLKMCLGHSITSIIALENLGGNLKRDLKWSEGLIFLGSPPCQGRSTNSQERSAMCNLYGKKLPGAQHHFAEDIWRPSWCQNWARDSSLEILTCIISKYTIFSLIGVDFPYQKFIFPRLIKKCWVMVQKCRVLVQKTFGGLPQLQIELMIAHWKSLQVYFPLES